MMTLSVKLSRMVYTSTSSHSDCKPDRAPRRQPGGEREAEYHGNRVGDRVDDAVAEIVERDRVRTVAVDDEVAVLEDFPSALDQYGEGEAQRRRRPPQHQPEEEIENEAVRHVRQRVPVEDVLGILGAVHDAVPQLDSAAGADGQAAHGPEDQCLQRNDRGHGQKEDPRRHTLHRHYRLTVMRLVAASAAIELARAGGQGVRHLLIFDRFCRCVAAHQQRLAWKRPALADRMKSGCLRRPATSRP